jgi:6-pyruvoyltetrahydropterin/6-carboxytetrahydropterin synthase
VRLVREYTFEAAHMLPRVAADHKCARMHGHSYKVAITVEGDIDADTGMVVDFAEIDAAVMPLLDGELDHRYLNDVAGLENPTVENLTIWVWQRLSEQMPVLLRAIEVRETATSAVIYEGGKELVKDST